MLRGSTLSIITLVLSAALLQACAEDSTDSTAPEAPAESPAEAVAPPSNAGSSFDATTLAMLQRVPADTPWVWVSAEPLPAEELPFQLEQLVPFYDTVLEHLAEKVADAPDAEGELLARQRVQRLLWATAVELDGKLSVEGLRSLGLSLQPRMVVYGHGLFPVARIEVADGEAVADLLDLVIERTGLTSTTHSLGNGEVAHSLVLNDRLSVVLGQQGKTLVAAVTPTGMLEQIVAHLRNGPSESLAERGTLDELAAAYGEAAGVGYVDIQGIISGVSGSGNPLVAASLRTLERPLLSGACATDWARIGEQFPRLVVTGQMVSLFDIRWAELTLEMSDSALIDELSALRGNLGTLAMPAGKDPSFAITANVDMERALSFVSSKGSGIATNPFECERLSRVNTAASRLSAAPLVVPSALARMQGGQLVIEDVLDTGEKRGVPRGWLRVETPEANGLWSLAAPKLLTDISASERPVLSRNDGLVDVEVDRFRGRIESAAVEQTASGLEARFGESTDERPEPWAMESGTLAPLFSVGWNSGKMWERWTARKADRVDDQRAGLMAVWTGVVSQYGMRQLSVDAGERGLVLRYERNATP